MENHKDEIQKIIGQLDCPKSFVCYTSGFENLCKARDIGLENYLDCLQAEPEKCPFALSFGAGYFCHCPLRIYLAKKLKR
jgi:hypothetical protein